MRWKGDDHSLPECSLTQAEAFSDLDDLHPSGSLRQSRRRNRVIDCPLGGSLDGKIVIDCMNPLGMGPDGLQLVLGFNTSAGEQVASWAPGAFVFKTLNTTGAGNMAKAADYRVKP